MEYTKELRQWRIWKRYYACSLLISLGKNNNSVFYMYDDRLVYLATKEDLDNNNAKDARHYAIKRIKKDKISKTSNEVNQ